MTQGIILYVRAPIKVTGWTMAEPGDTLTVRWQDGMLDVHTPGGAIRHSVGISEMVFHQILMHDSRIEALPKTEPTGNDAGGPKLVEGGE